jgi:hypothetical protein
VSRERGSETGVGVLFLSSFPRNTRSDIGRVCRPFCVIHIILILTGVYIIVSSGLTLA